MWYERSPCNNQFVGGPIYHYLDLCKLLQYLVEQLALIDYYGTTNIYTTCAMYAPLLYEALQDQSTAVPITVHNYGTVVYIGSAIYQLGPAVQPSVVVVYIDSDS